MKKIILALIAGTLMNVCGYADTKDLCKQLPGFYVGEEHVKSQSLCDQSNGCTHLVTVNADHTQSGTYHIKLQFTDGVNAKSQELDVTCENGKITIPVPYAYTLSTTCDMSNHCFMVYDDAAFSAELVKQ